MRSRLLALLVIGLLLGLTAPPAAGTAGFSIAAWGSDEYGQSTAPGGDSFVAVAAGAYHSLALRADGSIAAWGWDHEGQASPPAGNDFVAVAAGAVHSLALRADGSIAAWGDNTWDQATPPAGNDFVAIAAGWEHSLALRADGSIAAWGNNSDGQASPPAGNDFVAVAGGAAHSLALRANGSIVAWGREDEIEDTPRGRGFVAVASAFLHSLALRADGSIVGWGWDYFGQASAPAGNDYVAIAAGATHSLALRADGSIAGWGRDDAGQASPPAGRTFVSVSAGGQHSLATLDRSLPEAFGKEGPAEGATGQGDEVALSWGAAPQATFYEYCLDPIDDDSCAAWVDAGGATHAEVGGLIEGVTYFWQVRAHNDFGATEADGGAWWSFTTGPPGILAKISPPDGATGQSGRPALSWEAASGAAYYEYCVDASDDDACSAWIDAGTGTSATPVGLAYGTPYFWQVRAVNAFGTTDADGGAWWSFTTKPTPPVLELSFRSLGVFDGWVLEWEEESGWGDTLEAAAPSACLGDDDGDRQYRAILDFNTAGLSDDAVVVGVALRIRRESLIGTNPFLTHGVLKVDIKTGAFHGRPELESYDFRAVGSRGRVGRFYRADPDGWYRGVLRAPGYPLVNLIGHTQFRLRFDLDDDDDGVADCLSFFTGDAAVAADRPQLIISYYLP
jgi:hypothetical protein